MVRLVARPNAILRLFVVDRPLPSLHYRGKAAAKELTRQPDYPGGWCGTYLRLYATNAEPSIVPLLRQCLQHYHALMRVRTIVPAALPRFVPTDHPQRRLSQGRSFNTLYGAEPSTPGG